MLDDDYTSLDRMTIAPSLRFKLANARAQEIEQWVKTVNHSLENEMADVALGKRWASDQLDWGGHK